MLVNLERYACLFIYFLNVLTNSNIFDYQGENNVFCYHPVSDVEFSNNI